jgi:hypothetical protein
LSTYKSQILCRNFYIPELCNLCMLYLITDLDLNNNSVALVRERTMPTERLLLVGDLVPIIADRGVCVVSAADPYGLNLGFIDRRFGYYSTQFILM